MILIIGLCYPSLYSNPRNPPIKAFIFSLLMFFGSLLILGYQKGRERRSRPKEEHCLMLNLVVEKGASKDRDRSGSSITRPRTGTPTRFVQRSTLDFGLGTSPYIVDIYFILFSFPFSFYFSFTVVALISSLRVSLTPTLAVHLSIGIAIYFLIFPSYYLYFYLY